MIPGIKEGPKWCNRSIFHQNDGAHLDAKAALYEFQDGLPQAEAEEKAYSEYVRGRQVEAATHHLRGMKAAIAVGDQKAAQRHSALYTAHHQAIGGDPIGPVHADVQAHLRDNPGKFKFVGHKADSLIQPETMKSEQFLTTFATVMKSLAKYF